MTRRLPDPEQAARRSAYRSYRKRIAVYVIGSPEFAPVKIGYGFPEERLAAFQTGSPFLLRLLWTVQGTQDLEWALHETFRRYQVRGEWFAFPAGKDPVTLIAAEVAEIRRECPEWCGLLEQRYGLD